MSRKTDLEQNIRESYEIIRDYETIIRTSNHPEERQRARHMICKQRNLIKTYLCEYQGLPESEQGSMPQDIGEIVASQQAAYQACNLDEEPLHKQVAQSGQSFPSAKSEPTGSGSEQIHVREGPSEASLLEPELNEYNPTACLQLSNRVEMDSDQRHTEHPLRWLINKGKRLWIYYLLWLVVSALGFVTYLAGVLSMTRSQSLTLLALGGGVVLLGVSLVRDLRSRFEKWDRLLAGGLCIAVTVISGIFAFGKGLAFLPTLPTETPTSTPTGASAIPPIPTPTGTPVDTSTPAPIAIATPTWTPTNTPTPTWTPTNTPTPTPSCIPFCTPMVMIQKETNIRSGPGTTGYSVIATASEGETFEIVGRNQDTSWWQIRCIGGTQGWIYAALVETKGPIDQVLIVPPPPTMPIPTPDPKVAILALIEQEKQAVLNKDMGLIKSIFAANATKVDAATGMSWNAINRYEETFSTETHHQICHTNFSIALKSGEATVTNDSFGSLTRAEQKITYGCLQCDRWTFGRDSNGRWWITSMTYSVASTATSYSSTFEDGSECWEVRYDGGVPQGQSPVCTKERAHLGGGSLRFACDLTGIPQHRGQVVRYNMPFAGEASAYVYVPPDAPADLEAGFFAMDFDHDPWNYRNPTQMISLTPGQWTLVTWNVDVSGWAQPLHLLGIEVRQKGSSSYSGYILIDDVLIRSR